MDNNLTQVTASSDYKVNTTTGEAFMSRRELARLLGVSHTAINNKVSTLKPSYDGALSDFLVSEVSTQLVANGVVKDFTFVGKLMQAGARAFIYHQAGYTPQQPQLPAIDTETAKLLESLTTHGVWKSCWQAQDWAEIHDAIKYLYAGQTPPADGTNKVPVEGHPWKLQTWKPRLNRKQFFDECFDIVDRASKIPRPNLERASIVDAAALVMRSTGGNVPLLPLKSE